MPPVLYLRNSHAIVTRPINPALSKKRLQLLSSFLYYYYLSYWKVACFLIFSFRLLRRFVSVFWDSNFLEFFRLTDSC